MVTWWETNGQNCRTSGSNSIIAAEALANVLSLSLTVVCFLVNIYVSWFAKILHLLKILTASLHQPTAESFPSTALLGEGCSYPPSPPLPCFSVGRVKSREEKKLLRSMRRFKLQINSPIQALLCEARMTKLREGCSMLSVWQTTLEKCHSASCLFPFTFFCKERRL